MKFRLIGALVTVAVLILLVFSIPLASFVAQVERERLVTALERDAFVLAATVTRAPMSRNFTVELQQT